MKHYFVYILGNQKPVLYIGVTNDLVRRAWEHKQGLVDGFSKEYGTKKLLYFEVFTDSSEAIYREKQLKHWKREWKLELVKSENPGFADLYDSVAEDSHSS